MSRLATTFVRALLMVSAFALCNTAAVAKTIKGGPKELIGIFADRSEKCGDWSEDDGSRIEFSSYFYDTCGGQVCRRDIISHSRVRDGYLLNERHWLQKGKGPTSPQKIKVINADTIIYEAPVPTTLRRCPVERPQAVEPLPPAPWPRQPGLHLPPETIRAANAAS
jgi:hypothetical protein